MNLIGIRENNQNIILEGNRRLAAVKCLTDPTIVSHLGLVNKNIFSISSIDKQSLEELPVIFVSNRKEAWKFIGFKHINGPAKWGSYAKAKYISEIKNEFQIPLNDIADQIGDTHNTVPKLYQGLQVIEQAEMIGRFDRGDIQDNRLFFSHLYTALAYEGVKDFLGLKSISEETANPVPPEKADDLESFLLWLYGSKRKKIEKLILSQNPDLRYLEAVLRSKEATYALKDGVSLITAYDISQPRTKTFEQSLLEAKRALQKAQSVFTEGFDGEDIALFKLVGTVANIAEDLYSITEAKWSEKHSTEKKKRISED